MYTNIENKLLLERVGAAIEEALQWEHAKRGLKECIELGWNRAIGTCEVQAANEQGVGKLLKENVMYLL